MISPAQAQQLVFGHCAPLGAVVVTVDNALGHVLAEDIHSRFPLPPFDNSAMDGFAVRSDDTKGASSRRPVRLAIADAVFAGDVRRHVLHAGEASPITTGAALPRGADAIIPVEEAIVDSGLLAVERRVPYGRHVRRAGGEKGRGALVLGRGSFVGPGAIGCLATVGRERVRVIRRPRVSVIATGDETVSPGQRLLRGQIYDSNTHMLAALLRATRLEPVRMRAVGDRAGALSNAVSAALRESDVLVVAGGVSVGERDLLRPTLRRLGVREVFWRVRQKPGKPLYFGVKGRKVVFGLPGNPASVYTCFCLYVYPALKRLSGVRAFGLPVEERRLDGAVERDAARWRFIKAAASPKGRVAVLPGQASHMVVSLGRTDRLIVVPPGSGSLGEGSRVRTYRLPFEEVDG